MFKYGSVRGFLYLSCTWVIFNY